MNVGIIGYGNLGWHWVRQLSKTGTAKVHVFIRDSSKQEVISGVKWCATLSELASHCEFIVLAVNDSSIGFLSDQIAPFIQEHTIVIHCSGSTPITAIQNISHRAVLWPMMTIKKAIDINWQSCPLFIQYEHEEDRERLFDFAHLISDNLFEFDEKDREYFHLAAVWSNNFVNHIIHKAYELLEEHQLPPQLLLPMLRTHLDYLDFYHPKQLQTGPAQREDQISMNRHKALMKEEDQELYKMISESIINQKKQR